MELSEYKLETLKMIYDGLIDPIDPDMQAMFLESKLVVVGKGIYPLELTEDGIDTLVESTHLLDLFDHHQDMPADLEAIFTEWQDRLSNGMDYPMLEELLAAVGRIGYTFNYYLDAEPYNLVKKPASGALTSEDYVGLCEMLDQGAIIRHGLVGKAALEENLSDASMHQAVAEKFERWSAALRVMNTAKQEELDNG